MSGSVNSIHWNIVWTNWPLWLFLYFNICFCFSLIDCNIGWMIGHSGNSYIPVLDRALAWSLYWVTEYSIKIQPLWWLLHFTVLEYLFQHLKVFHMEIVQWPQITMGFPEIWCKTILLMCSILSHFSKIYLLHFENWTLWDLKQHSHITTDWPLPHHPRVVLISKVLRKVYLAYM